MDVIETALANPLVRTVAYISGAVIVLAIIRRALRARREARVWSNRREEVRKQRGYLYMQQQEIDRLAGRILATSQTQSIPGFAVLRQVDAVFTDGHVSQPNAVLVLKAISAEKGANAIINLTTERLPNGKCSASGDAVVVRAPAD